MLYSSALQPISFRHIKRGYGTDFGNKIYGRIDLTEGAAEDSPFTDPGIERSRHRGRDRSPAVEAGTKAATAPPLARYGWRRW